jgi:hypothetical protein
MTPAGDAVTVAQFQASGEIRTPLAAATRWPQGRCYQRDDFATFANFDLLAFFNPIEHGAEIVPDLPDGGGFHVSRRCDTWRRLSTPANEGNVELAVGPRRPYQPSNEFGIVFSVLPASRWQGMVVSGSASGCWILV